MEAMSAQQLARLMEGNLAVLAAADAKSPRDDSDGREAQRLVESGLLTVVKGKYFATSRARMLDGRQTLHYLRNCNWRNHFMDFYAFWDGVRVGHEWSDHFEAVDAFREHSDLLFRRIFSLLTTEEVNLVGARRHKDKYSAMAEHLKKLAIVAAVTPSREASQL